MDNFQRLLNLATSADIKKNEVGSASVQKKADFGALPDMYQTAAGIGNTDGLGTAGEIETDLRTMNPAQLQLTYGPGVAGELQRNLAQGVNELSVDRNQLPRDLENVVWDSASGIAGGFAAGLANIGAFGVGLVNDDAGAAVSRAVDAGMAGVQATQSEPVQAARRVQAARSALTSRDNAQRYDDEVAAGDSKFAAGLRQFGRDFIDSMDNSTESGVFVGQGVSEAVGSLLSGAPLAAGLRKVGSAVLGGAAAQRAGVVAAELDRATGVMSTARVLDRTRRIGGGAAWPLAIAGLEGGGAYTGTVNEIMGMSFEQLQAGSQKFRDLVASGVSQEDARTQIANEAGQEAAAIQAPIGGVTGLLTRALENPLRVPSVGSALRQAAFNEPVEEAIQSASGQIAQNLAVQRNADINQRLVDGAGEASAQGALFGFGSAGAVQTPGVALLGGRRIYQGARAAVQSVVDAGKPLFQALVERGDRIIAQREKASPVSEEAVAAAAETAMTQTPEAVQAMADAVASSPVDEAVKAEAGDYITKLSGALQITPDELAGEPASVQNYLAGITSRAAAVAKMADAVNKAPTEQAAFDLATILYDMMAPVRELQEADPVAFDSLPADSPALGARNMYNEVLSAIDATPTVQRALRKVASIVAKAQDGGLIKEVTPESLGTAEGKQNVRNAVAVAGLHPDKGNLKANEQILAHAAAGRLNLTPNQLATLKVSTELLRARQKMEAAIKTNGIRQAKDVVSEQIVGGNDPLRKIAKSAAQHTREILSAMTGGNMDLAAGRLQDFGKFVQHMQNKVEATNTHFRNGNNNADRVQFMQLQPNGNREFKLSTERAGMYVQTHKASSIDFSQSMALEASTLADVYNGIVDTFPELGQPHITAVDLDPALIGNPEELSKEFRARQVSARPAVQPAPAPAPAPAAAAAPIQQPTETTNGSPATERSDGAPADAPRADQPADRVGNAVPDASPADAQDGPVERPEPAMVAEQLPATASSEASEQPASVTPLDGLYGGDRNYTRKAFSYPQEARTRLGDEDSSIATVRQALSSQTRLSSFLGSAARNTLTPVAAGAYQRLLSKTLAPVLKSVEDQLSKFLNEPYNKKQPKGKTIGEMFLSDAPDINRWSRGKVLNLVEQDADGNLSYQGAMLEQASLAAMQWLLTADSYTSVMDEADVAKLTGINEADLTRHEGLVQELTQGMSQEQAVHALSAKIVKYWGLTQNKGFDLAYAEGIPNAMAAELLRAMEANGLISAPKTTLTPDEHGVAKQKDIIRIVVNPLEEAEALSSFPDAIETAVMVEPESTNFIGDVTVPVAQRQMNNNEVANTKNQKDALEKEQQTPFYVNPMMVSFYASLGKDNLLALFGTPVGDTEVYNDNHLMTVEGRNQSITAAYDQLFSVVADAANVAATAGTALDQTPIRYAYNMSRVGRMQMLGKYSPQASKLVREAILPTRSTLDLSNENSDQFAAYGLGLAQALGIKVHNMPTADSVRKVMGMMSGPLAPAVEVVREWLSDTDLSNPMNMTSQLTPENVTTIRDAFKAAGADLSMVGMHALVDYARYLASDNRSEFTTSVYLEADGVTNGPINAMALMSIGGFTLEWVKNMRKGGLAFGPSTTMADIRSAGNEDGKDLYQASTDAARARLSELRNSLDSDGTEQMNHLLNLMSLFNKDVSFDPNKAWEDNALELSRGVAKNPLTITIYGSGERGIAGKLTGNLAKEIYAQMSTLLQAQKSNPELTNAQAMFPNDPNADAKMKLFSDSIEALTTNSPRMSEKGMYFVRVGQAERSFNPKKFSFNAKEMEVLEKNMLELFVKPMRQGITDTVGAPLMKAVAVLRDAAQVQSVFQESMFVARIDQTLADREKNDSSYRRGDFLSTNDLDYISKSLRKVSPLVQTGDQTFLVSGQQAMELDGRDLQYGRALNDTIRVNPSVYAPAQAGVRAIPMMTIGMGDGMMMQLLAQQGLQGTLKIFDGMNVPLDKIRDYSERANGAVYESWKGNPHAQMLKSFDTFIDTITEADVTSEITDTLARTLNLDELARSPADVIAGIKALRNQLEWSARSIDARHAAIESMAVSVDQMAAAGQPFTNGVEGPALTNEQALEMLNAKYQENMQRGAKPTPVPVVSEQQAPAEQAMAPAIEKVGRVAASGVRILSQTALEQLARGDAMTEAQKAVYGEIRRSGAASGYKVVAGTPAQLDAYIAEHGLSARPAQEVHGWINVGDRTIYMANPSTETLVHELVHASSYETLLSYYNNGNLGENRVAVSEAIIRLESMMNEFLAMDERAMAPGLRTAYESARSAILSSNLESDSAVAQAKALNEFMAWGLTNDRLTAELKAKPVPAFVKMAKEVIKAIKQLIWGKKVAPKVADDFLSNLQFNAGVIIRSQPSIGAIARDGELYHSAWYGDNERISAVRQTFGQKIVDLLKTEKDYRGAGTRQGQVSAAQMMANDTARIFNARGFPMTPQENITFRMIVAALATEAEIDPNALARAQELFTHVSKTMKVEHFMSDPESLEPDVRYYAQEKFSAIMGSFSNAKDAQDRSTMLPAFLALATVNDEFRSVLAKLPLPKTAKNNEGTLDAMLENAGTFAMDSLSRRLSGDITSANVKNSVDNLMQHIHQVAQDEQSFIDQYASKAGNIMDRLNQGVTEGLQAGADLLMAKATAAEKNASNRLTQLAARTGQLLAGVASESNGQAAAEMVTTVMNNSKLWEPLRTFMSDLVGRTESNANVYDMIKTVRSAVQQTRQQFRDGVPTIIAGKFSRKLEAREWTSLYNGLGKTDLALLRSTMSHKQIGELFGDQNVRDAEINALEAQIQAFDRRHWPTFEAKMKQLANFMNTGVAGVNLLRNVEAVSRLLNERRTNSFKLPDAATKAAMDKLITLYAVDMMPEAQRNTVASLVQNEAAGVSFVLDYLVGQRKEELKKTVGNTKLNAYKGYLPNEQQSGASMLIADDTQFADLAQRGFQKLDYYHGSSTETFKGSKSYYFAPMSGRPIFNQGIMQNVRHTAGGVDATTGFTVGMTAGLITDKANVQRLLGRMHQEKATAEALMPVFDASGNVIALERAVDPRVTAKLEKSTDLARMIGVWRGRQVEESMSQMYNDALVGRLKTMYDTDMAASRSNQSQYVNLLSSKVAKDNAIIADAVSLFTQETMATIKAEFGDEFWVRRDMIRDAIGERAASVGDIWNGVTKLNESDRNDLRKALVGAFGINTYRNLVRGEEIIQNFMADMRTLIVVKSMIVPAVNFVSNVYQLVGRGVPMTSIARGMPAKLAEIDSYAKTRLRQIEVEAEIRASANPAQTRRLETELESITDAHKRLSIWPLIQAGEFSSIADVGMQAEDLDLTSGKLSSYIERQVDRLPDGVKTAGRYALITKDTSLYRGLQKSVQYGDFIAKAVLYDDLVKRQKKTKAEALARVTEEFVNYDRLPGRFRSYLENMGLLWFYNFKIRSTKVALSTIRNNPVHALLAMGLPAPAFLGSVGSPITDNIAAKALSDTLGSSVGTDMAFRAPTLNPWYNLVN